MGSRRRPLLQSKWTLYKVWSRDLEELSVVHKESGYQFLSRLHLAEKLFDATKFPDHENNLDVSQHFALVEVKEIAPIDQSHKDKLLIVRGLEPRVADNLLEADDALRFNVAFKSDLSNLMKDKLMPGDIIVTLRGRHVANLEERVTQIEMTSSYFSSAIIIMYRPFSCENTENKENYVERYPQLKLEVFEAKERFVLRISPKTADVSEEVSAKKVNLEAQNINNVVAARNVDVNENEYNPEMNADSENSNSSNSTDGWERMPVWEEHRNDEESISEDEEPPIVPQTAENRETSLNEVDAGTLPNQSDVNSPYLSGVMYDIRERSLESFTDVSHVQESDEEIEELFRSSSDERNPRGGRLETESNASSRSSSSISLFNYTRGEVVVTPSIINAPIGEGESATSNNHRR